jgi:dTDP-4-dehydrorhamnose reductase
VRLRATIEAIARATKGDQAAQDQAGMPSTLLVTGASGYLGLHLMRHAADDWQAVGTHLSSPPSGLHSYRLDVTDVVAVNDLLAALRPAVVIHLAYRQAQPRVNVEGTRNVAAACQRIGARLVLTSTDLVFGAGRGWYRESDAPSPIEPYGASKVVAEREVLERGGLVVRTSLIYGFDPLDPRTHGLVAAPLQQGRQSKLFVDEYRCPVYAPDLAAALLELAAGSHHGLLHVTGPQRLSRYDFGLKLAAFLGLDPRGLIPTSIAHSDPPRSPDCSLDTSLARRLLRTPPRSVDEVLASRPPLSAPFRSP